MKPVAWAVFAENGNIRVWSPDQEPVRAMAVREGLTVTPLYTQQKSALMVLDAIYDARYELPDFIIEEIKEKFGVEI